MYESKLEKTRKEIKELAKQFGLKYKENLFKVSFVTKRERVILNYLAGCPASSYAKFGKTKKERIRRIGEFLNSDEFSSLVKEQGGCVITKKGIQSSIKKLKNKKLKEELNFILKKFKPTPFGSTVLTKPENSQERRFSKTILFHEWIHVLLNSNKIYFQNIKPEYWKLDEGLVTYLQTFFKTKKADISDVIKKRMKKTKKSSLYLLYAKNALKFNVILKNKKEPIERRRTILDYIKKISG